MVFLDKNIEKFLVTSQKPGIFFFKNGNQFWGSFSANVAEAYARNIKLINNGGHPIKSLEGWESAFILYNTKEEAKIEFIKLCLNIKEKKWDILNKQFNYSVKGIILEDYREPNYYGSSQFLYYVFLMAGKRKVRVLGVFPSVAEGKVFISQCSANGGGFKEASNPLSMEFFKLDLLKEEYKKLVQDE